MVVPADRRCNKEQMANVNASNDEDYGEEDEEERGRRGKEERAKEEGKQTRKIKSGGGLTRATAAVLVPTQQK